jgi:hypothetical protein
VGSERHIVCFEGLLLVMFAIGTQNILLSCFLTYIISGVSTRFQQCCAVLPTAAYLAVQAFFLVWKELYQVNLSNKSLVDERFLL